MKIYNWRLDMFYLRIVLLIFSLTFALNIYAQQSRPIEMGPAWRPHSIEELNQSVRKGLCCENGVEDPTLGELDATELITILSLWLGFPTDTDWRASKSDNCTLIYPDGTLKKDRNGNTKFFGPCPEGVVRVSQEAYERDMKRVEDANKKFQERSNSVVAKQAVEKMNSILRDTCGKISGISVSLKEGIASYLSVNPDSIYYNRKFFKPASTSNPDNIFAMANFLFGDNKFYKGYVGETPSCGIVVYSPRGPVNMSCSSSMVFERNGLIVDGCRFN